MKKWILNVILLLIAAASMAQVDSTTPPYKKFPTLPPVQLLLGDSTTKFTKEDFAKKPVLIMLFSPECSHCQHEAEALSLHSDEMKNIQVVMITFHPLWQMNEFAGRYKLNELKNIVVGKDIYLILPSFYGIRNLPFHALYNKKGNLISVVEGSAEISKLIEEFSSE
jgi:thiol-disulfide isomerase/thioredoxin